MNSRYQPYRYNRCQGQANGSFTKIAPYSEMTLQDLSNLSLAMAYVPWQDYGNIYAQPQALRNGTIFAELNLDFAGRRCN